MSESTSASHAIARPHPTRWGVAALFGLLGAVLVAVVVTAFLWPAATSTPHDLPVGISGPQSQISAIEEVLAEQDPSPITLSEVESREDAVGQIEAREIYGAILLGDEPEVLIAGGAGAAPAQILRGIAAQLQSQIDATVNAALTEKLTALVEALQTGQMPALGDSDAASAEPPTVTVTDIVPLSDDDPTGSGLAAASFPLVLGGIIGGVLLTLLVQGAVRRLVGLAVYAVAAGAGIALVMQTWFGFLQGDWLLNAAVAALAVGATSSLVVGLAALIGPAGIGVGALITMFIANPISGAAMPWQFLPEPWGAIGQWFVPGASSTLLRSTSYFPDSDTSVQWLTLGAWAAAGVVLTLIGHRRTRAELTPPPSQLED